jgi:hypothetical protein
MTQAPTSITSPRYGMILPEKQDRVLVDVITQAFLDLDAQTAALTFNNVFTGTQVFQNTVTFQGAAIFQSTVSVQSLTVAGNLNMPNTASQINLGPSGAFIKAYAGDATYVHVSKLTVTPGTTSLASLTVNGNAQINGGLTATGNVSGNWVYANGNHFWFGAGAWMRYGSSSPPGRIDTSSGFSAPDLHTGGAIYAYGGVVYFEPSNAVNIQWRGDLGALYFPYGNGIYAEGTSNFAALNSRGALSVGTTIYAGSTISTPGGLVANTLQTSAHIDIRGLYMPTTPRGDRPPYVLANYGDGWAAWVVSDAVGRSPPVSVVQIATSGGVPAQGHDGWTDNWLIALNTDRAGQWLVLATHTRGTYAAGAQMDVGGNSFGYFWNLDQGSSSWSAFAADWWQGFLGAGARVQAKAATGSQGGGTLTLRMWFLATKDYPT